MVSTIRYSSAKSTTPSGRRGFYIVLGFAAVGMGIWFFSQYVLVTLAALYVVHGVVWWLLRPVFVRPLKSQDAAG
jgi:hypothetical protein